MRITEDTPVSEEYLPPNYVRVLIAVYHCRLHGITPTYRNIAKMTGYKTHGPVAAVVVKLVELGLLDKEKGMSGTLVTTHSLLLIPEALEREQCLPK